MLGVALSSATRLAVLLLAAGLSIGVVARSAAAQNPPTTQSTGPTTQAATTAQPAALVVPPTATPPVVAPIVAPVAGQQLAAPTTPALSRPAVQTPTVQSPSVARTAAPANPTPLGARTNPTGRPGAPPPAATSSANASSPALIGGKADSMISRLTPQMDLRLGGQAGGDGLRLSGTVGVVVMMGLLTLLPTLVLMMTGFTRILIVLNFLRQAIGTQSAPPAHLVAALSLILTGFVMGPTLNEVNRTAITPWMDGQIEQTEMLKIGAKPFRAFMLRQTREKDLATFVEMSKMQRPTSIDDVPLVVVVSAFVTSELRTAFQIGFTLFLPFIIIDIVVSAVLMSMGMMMLPPAMIALPFKLLLFVLVDGWTLVIQSLVASFH
jgi:flagellar biosynthetic protein FliP